MNLRVVIHGCGIAGMMTALAIKKNSKHSIIYIIDSHRAAFANINHVGIWGTAMRCIQNVGLIDRISPYIQPVLKSGYKSVQGSWLAKPVVGVEAYPGIHFILYRWTLS